MLTVEDLTRLVAAGEIDTVVVAFTDVYGRLVGKRFDAGFFLESGVEDGTHVCNYLLTVDMEMEPIEGYELANWEAGYGDFHLHPDMSTLRQELADALEANPGQKVLVRGDRKAYHEAVAQAMARCKEVGYNDASIGYQYKLPATN